MKGFIRSYVVGLASLVGLTACLGTGKTGSTTPAGGDVEVGMELSWPKTWRSHSESGPARNGGSMMIELLTFTDGSLGTTCFENSAAGCASVNDNIASKVAGLPVYVQGFQPHVSKGGLVFDASQSKNVSVTWSISVLKATVTTARFSFDASSGQPTFSDVVTKDLLGGGITAGSPASCKVSGDTVVGLDPGNTALTGLTLVDEATPLPSSSNGYTGGYLRAGLIKAAGLLPGTPGIVEGVADPFPILWVPDSFDSMDTYVRFGWQSQTISSEPVPTDLANGVLPYFGHEAADVSKNAKVGSIDDRVIVGWCLEARKVSGSTSRSALLFARSYLGKPLATQDEDTKRSLTRNTSGR